MGDIMKFIINRAYRDWNKKDTPPCKNAQRNRDGQWVVEINTISELIELNKEVEQDLIFRYDKYTSTPDLLIYDDWIE